jgi:hypothetical protein
VTAATVAETMKQNVCDGTHASLSDFGFNH